MFEKKTSPITLLCCAPDPNSRQSICEKLTGAGYQVIATGNPQIASGLMQEHTYRLLILCLEQMRLSFISTLADARRSNPDMAVLVMFTQPCRENIPDGLADMTLIQPSDLALQHALKILTKPRLILSKHGTLTAAP